MGEKAPVTVESKDNINFTTDVKTEVHTSADRMISLMRHSEECEVLMTRCSEKSRVSHQKQDTHLCMTVKVPLPLFDHSVAYAITPQWDDGEMQGFSHSRTVFSADGSVRSHNITDEYTVSFDEAVQSVATAIQDMEIKAMTE